MLAEEYRRAFLRRRQIIESGGALRGRILRGKCEADFATLSDDPRRRLVMLLGLDGLRRLVDMSGYEMLQFIGYTEEAIRYRIESGMKFKLLVFENNGISRLATWTNTLDAVASSYDGLRDYVDRFREELIRTSFAEIEQMAGYSFWEVEKAKEQDSRYMTYERLLAAPRSLVAFRAFLYHEVHLRELYRGDGFTDYFGNTGPAEYIARNIALVEIEGHELIDLEVKLP